MSHHSKYHFIAQYIPLRGTAANEVYRLRRMGVAVLLEVTEQRPMNNDEHVNIMN